MELICELLKKSRSFGVDHNFWKELTSNGPLLAQVAETVKEAYTYIDCSSAPFCPSRLKVLHHTVTDSLNWDEKLFDQFRPISQIGTGVLSGSNFLKKIKSEKFNVANANVLDWLLAHQDFIPEVWKNDRTYFWGTTYTWEEGKETPIVRYLAWDNPSKKNEPHWVSSWSNIDNLSLDRNCYSLILK